MKCGQVAVLLSLVAAALGCTYIPKLDQEDYCFADYAFEAEVKESRGLTNGIDYEYEIYIHTVYKGDIKEKLATDTVFGDGPMMSCGPQVLKVGITYVIYATERDGRVNLLSYRERDQMNDDDIKRMTQKYDCSCTIKFNYDKLFGVALAPELPPATEDECNVPDEWCSRNAYCQRNDEGQCTWGELGSCE
uniref:Uncharacterized protein LOC111110845 isoform X1 n=1 Tax=Crassostrea virginica TaxID=6565 RepID=A0A8B8BIT0_CRAVI|nr:uncharacterized protein LOC111110845 isoform X1 [Crassostrea virginica]